MKRILSPELKMVATPALLQRGCVVVIGLEAIRDEAGPRWERMRTSIYSHLESLLRQKLGPSDYYTQLDDLSFLVSAPAFSPEEAQVLCVRVAHELHLYFLGRCEIRQLRIARATRLDGDILQCDMAENANLERLAAQAGLPPSKNWNPRLATPVSRPPALPPPERARSPSAPRFVPLWDIQTEAVTTYRCVAVAEGSPFENLPPQAAFKSDLESLLARFRFGTDLLARQLGAGRKFLLSLPISYDLLGSPVARMEVAAFCRSLPSAMRTYLQFEIGELPYGVPQSRLSELVGSLRPFCRGVAAHLPARIPSYGAYQGAGLNGIGLSLSAANVLNTDMNSEMFKLAAAAARLNIKSFVLDVPNIDMLMAAHRLRVTSVSGPMIGEPREVPGPVKRVPLSEIVARETRGGVGDAARVLAACA